jgi:hypothetical protein
MGLRPNQWGENPGSTNYPPPRISPLSSRPKRSVVEGSAVRSGGLKNLDGSLHHTRRYGPDRRNLPRAGAGRIIVRNIKTGMVQGIEHLPTKLNAIGSAAVRVREKVGENGLMSPK